MCLRHSLPLFFLSLKLFIADLSLWVDGAIVVRRRQPAERRQVP